MPEAPPAVIATYRAAGFWRRLVAAVVDCAALLPFALSACVVTAAMGGLPAPRLSEIGFGWLIGLALDGGVAGPSGVAIGLLVGELYAFLFVALRGQTPGKRLLGLRVIDAYGERPSLQRALVRTLGYAVSGFAFSLGFFWIGFDREKRGLHDWLAGTYVVHEPRPIATATSQASIGVTG